MVVNGGRGGSDAWWEKGGSRQGRVKLGARPGKGADETPGKEAEAR